MPTSTVTTKGQITIPKQVRESLGVSQGDRVEFIMGPGRPVSLRPLGRSVRELAGFLAREARAASLEEMDASVLELIAEEDDRVRPDG